jgi:hypothetical protein
MADAVSKSLSDLTKELSKSNNSAKESEALRLKEQKEQLDQMEKDAKEKGIELKDNKKFRDAQLAHQKADLDFRSKNSTSRAAQIEINKEKSKLEESYFKKYLGKNSFFAKGFSSIGDSLRKKVGSGIDSIFKALKAGAFILFLGGLKKFLESDLFQEITDKIIPFIVTGLQNLKDAFDKFKQDIPIMIKKAKEFINQLKEKVLPKIIEFSEGIYDAFLFVKQKIKDINDYINSDEFQENFTKTKKVLGIFTAGFGIIRDVIIGIYDTFWDEDGNFKGLNGIKEHISNIAEGFENFSKRIREGFYDEDGNFSISAGFANIGTEISNITSAFSQVALSLGAMLLLVKPSKFFGLLGVVGRGGFALGRGVLRGISSSFSKVFTALTGLGTDVSDLQVDMDTKNKNAKKTGVFSKKRGIGGKFGKLFGLVGRFGGLIAGVGIGMLSQIDLSKVFTTVGDNFKSLFGVVTDFGSRLAEVASKATAKVASVVADALNTVKNIGKTSIGTPQTKGGALRRELIEKVKVSAKPKPVKLATLDTVLPKVPMMQIRPPNSPKTKVASFVDDAPVGKGGKAADIISQQKLLAKVSAELSKTALKTSLARKSVGVLLKAAPAIGIAAGVYLTASRALSGDLKGATAEFGGIFLPSLAGLPVDLGLAARDVYKDQFDIFPEDEPDKALRYERMKQITAYIKSNMPKKAEIEPRARSRALVPVGQYSSARAGGQRGLIMAGDETSALDQLARTMVVSAPTVVNNQSSTTNVMSRPITDTSFGGVISSR